MDRIALVIGNGKYIHVGPLSNPINDANDIESVLLKLNFQVTKVLDADLSNIQNAINAFLKELDEYAVGLLYYAGHGMQIDGKNYIVPVDLEMADKGKTIVSCYCLDTFLEGVSSYKGKTIICILDACRNNPFTIGRGFSSGFASVEPPKGTIVAYSTSKDCTAYDGQNSNGLYTQVLKDEMLIPNLKIEDMFKSVRQRVSDISIKEYDEEQLSWEYSSLMGDFYFSVTPQSVNANVSDKDIYDYICKKQTEYTTTSENIYDIECLPYVDAYEHFGIPIIKLLRAFFRVHNQKQGYYFSDQTIDQLSLNYLSSWGFYQEYGRWYYNNHYVEMGDLLPLPDEMKPQKPIKGQELEIEATLKADVIDGKVRFVVESNIPDETPIIFTLRGKNYNGQYKTMVNDGQLMSGYFSDKGNPLKKGYYTIEITSPIDRVLPDPIKKIFGERNRNLCGKYIKFDPVMGNTIQIAHVMIFKGDACALGEPHQKP